MFGLHLSRISVALQYCLKFLLYSGIPETPNIEEFNIVWKRSGHLKLNSITLLASLIRTQEEAMMLHERLKFSAFERDLALFVVEHREPKLNPKPLLPYQNLLAKSKSKQRDVKEWILEVLKYNNSPLVEEFKNWDVPKFPVNGIMLREAGVEAGRTMGNVMNELKYYWADHEFNVSAEELMKLVPDICSKLSERRKK